MNKHAYVADSLIILGRCISAFLFTCGGARRSTSGTGKSGRLGKEGTKSSEMGKEGTKSSEMGKEGTKLSEMGKEGTKSNGKYIGKGKH